VLEQELEGGGLVELSFLQERRDAPRVRVKIVLKIVFII
jgi:hypothetical protein